MSSLRLLLVRHGETVWNQENRWQGQADIPLSDSGHAQALRLAQRLRAEGRQVQAIYSSDLVRALRTAQILGETLGIQPFHETGWREMDIGRWSGLTTSEVATRYADEWERLRAGEDLPRGGGETFAQFQGRLVGSVQRLLARHAGQQVMIVSHGGAVRAFLLHCRGLAMGQFRQIEKIGNTGLSEVTVFADGRAEIHAVNDTAHLDGEALFGETVDA
ncbi:MAG: histidine phosphatase family protein [Deltaproteobacteria bacterium]|nr:histidine phosphatase family protein [Deltaproteobacteria bacterium]